MCSRKIKTDYHVDPNLKEGHSELWIKKITPKINEPLKNWNNQKIHYGAIINSKFIQLGFMELIFPIAYRDINVYTDIH